MLSYVLFDHDNKIRKTGNITRFLLWWGLDFKECVSPSQVHQSTEPGLAQGKPTETPSLVPSLVVYSPSHFAPCVGKKKTLKVKFPSFVYSSEVWLSDNKSTSDTTFLSNSIVTGTCRMSSGFMDGPPPIFPTCTFDSNCPPLCCGTPGVLAYAPYLCCLLCLVCPVSLSSPLWISTWG